MLTVHHISPPQPRLSPYVLAYSTSSDLNFQRPQHTYYAFPTTHNMLVWHGRGHWRGDRLDFERVDDARLVVIRPGLSLTPIPTEQGSLIVIFRPGGARRVLGISTDALPPFELPLAELIDPGEALNLAETLAMQPSCHDRIQQLERWLLKRLERSRHDRSLCAKLCAQAPLTQLRDVRALAQHSGCSTRQLHKHFIADLGISPKQYLTLYRLRVALAASLKPTYSWMQIVEIAQYYDQSHLIRDFQAMLGHSPEAFRALVSSSERLLDGLATPHGADPSKTTDASQP